MDVWACMRVHLNARIYSVIQCQRPLKSMNAEYIKGVVAQHAAIKLLSVCVYFSMRWISPLGCFY